jgi:uncharacterized protein YecE (DUF72 family)
MSAARAPRRAAGASAPKRRAEEAPPAPARRAPSRRGGAAADNNDDDDGDAPPPQRAAFWTRGACARVRIATSGFTLPQRRYWALFDTLEARAGAQRPMRARTQKRIATRAHTRPPHARAARCISSSASTAQLNATFYRTPAPPIWAGWASKRPRPSSTCYVVKAHQYFTHRKRLRLDDALRARWAAWWGGGHAGALHAAGCLACLLWQLPPNFTNTPENFGRVRDALLSAATSPVAATAAALAASATSAPPLRCAIEFRHSSWHRADVYAALRAANWCLVTTVQRNEPQGAGGRRWAGDLTSGATPPLIPQQQDAQDAASLPLLLPVLTCSWGAYVRFHGGAGQYTGRHGDAAMRGWAGTLRALLQASGGGSESEQRRVFVAFNNTDDARPLPSAVADALALARELRRTGCCGDEEEEEEEEEEDDEGGGGGA